MALEEKNKVSEALAYSKSQKLWDIWNFSLTWIFD